MPTKKQRQQNADDAGSAFDRFRDLSDKHLPRTRAAIVNYMITISGKRGY